MVARDTGKHPPEHRAAPTTKNDPALRVTSGRLRNPGLQGQDFSWVSGQWPLGKEPESSKGNVADRYKGACPRDHHSRIRNHGGFRNKMVLFRKL